MRQLNLISGSESPATIVQCEAWVSENPEDLPVLARLAGLYARAGRLEQALSTFLKVGEVHEERGSLVKAISLYKAALRLDPGSAVAMEKLAVAYERYGLLREATLFLKTLVELYRKQQQTGKLEETLRTLNRLDPSAAAETPPASTETPPASTKRKRPWKSKGRARR